MERPSDLGHLKTSEWNLIQEIANRFEDAWRKDGSADLAVFLPPADDPLRPVALQELIKSDLEVRWRRGQGLRLEDYLQRFPELGTAATLPLRLLYEEFRVRQLHGDHPALEEYRGRFPELFGALGLLLREEPLPTISRAAPTPPLVRSAPTPFVSPSPQKNESPGVMSNSEGDMLPGGGGFRKLRRIGTGGFGEVWLAEAPGGIHVAIKMLYRPLDHEEAQRELRTLELIKQLSHPFLLHTQQFWALSDRLYIVMDLAGGSLRDRHKECRLQGLPGIPLPELLRYFRQAAEAIDYLHSEHVLHRDIKPDNILLLKGYARVADFGLARAHQQPTVSVSGSGTPAYMAPEVWRGKASEQSDLYAFALTYAEMRLGRRPFGSNDYMGVMLDHLETPPDLAPLGPAEQQVLLKALAKNPVERYPTCRAFSEALDEALAPELKEAAAGPATVGPPGPGLPTGHSPGELKTDRDAPPSPANLFGTIGARKVTVPPSGQEDTDVELLPTQLPQPGGSRKQLVRAIGGLLAVLLLAGGGIVAYSIFGPPSTTEPRDKGRFSLSAPLALKLQAGEEKTASVQVRRDRFTEPIELRFEDVPEHLSLAPATIPAEAEGVEVKVTAGERVAPGVHRVTIRARAGDQSEQGHWEITVDKGPDGVLLVGWKEGPNAAIIAVDGKHYYSRIVLNKHGLDVPFVLVPGDDGSAFYVMENKVSNEQFADFATKNPGGKPSEWHLGGRRDGKDLTAEDGRLPVLRVTVDEADQFAKWLGGLLPTMQQWDRAAGYPPRDGRKGPAGEQRTKVAVNRVKEGPLPVGASDDISPLGVRDLSGNGREFTRNLVGNQMVPQPGAFKDDLVILRGRTYTAPGPLLYSDLDYERDHPQTQYYLKASPYTGFRVVLELRAE